MSEGPVTLAHESLRIELLDEPMYTMGSADNVRAYDRELDFTDGGACISTHGVRVVTEQTTHTAVLAASGGPTGVHEHSGLVVRDRLFVAVCDRLACLTLPDLAPAWSRKADPDTVFGVWWSEPHSCLVTHGELSIARWDLDGNQAWEVSGEDIFTEGFALQGDLVVAKDFNGREYSWTVSEGATT